MSKSTTEGVGGTFPRLAEVIAEHASRCYQLGHGGDMGRSVARCRCNWWTQTLHPSIAAAEAEHAAHAAAAWLEVCTIRSRDEAEKLPQWTLLKQLDSRTGRTYQRLGKGVDDLGTNGDGGIQTLAYVEYPVVVIWAPGGES